MAQLSDSQIEAMMKKGFTRWTKGDKDRFYIKGWKIDGVTTNWKKNGKKTVSINGEELTYTKSAIFSTSSNYVDVKTGEVVTSTDDRRIGDFIRNQISSMIPKELAKSRGIGNTSTSGTGK